MSITKNVFTLKKAYELIVDGQWATFDLGDSFTPNTPGTLWTWGENQCGSAGINTVTNDQSSPTQIPGNNWQCISQGSGPHTIATKGDGTLWAFGNAYCGALGLDNLINRSSPTQIPGNNWQTTGAGFNASFAIKCDNTLWSWGRGFCGQLGLDSSPYLNISSPRQIPGNQWLILNNTQGTNIQAVMAIKTDGTLWSWGRGTSGYLGLGNQIGRSSPTQLPGQWICVSSGTGHTIGLKSDGTLWAWGSNFRGQLGVFPGGTPGDRSSPIQIPGNQWNRISADNQQSMATKVDGTMWGWGFDINGQLGLSKICGNYVSSPTQIPGTAWCDVSVGCTFSHAKKTDGTLWGWGNNGGGGMVGDGTNVDRSSPVQIPGNQWYEVSSHKAAFARKAL